MTTSTRKVPFAAVAVSVLVLFAACAAPAPPAPTPPLPEPEPPAEAPPPEAVEETVAEEPAAPVVVAEAWETVRRPEEDLGAVAVWPGAGDRAWLLAAAEATDRLLLYDAGSGDALRDFGGAGDGDGRFRRPAGLWIADDLAFVAERGNARVQVLRLPGLSTVGHVAAGEAAELDGVRGAAVGGGVYELWTAGRGYRVRVLPGGLEAAPLAAGGDAPEAAPVLDGAAAGPRAAALYPCPDGGGYWLLADPSAERTVFRVLDRASGEPLGAFRGEVTAGTDGVWLSTVPIPDFPAGALYAVHDDASVTAFDWRHVAAALGLRADCASDGK